MSWSAKQYVAFEGERTRPVRDLLSAVPDPAGAGGAALRAIDLGCGPGNSTEVLASRFPGAVIEGLDTSPDMLAAARQRLPGVRFQEMDIHAWVAACGARGGSGMGGAGGIDAILANAVLQWVPDHARLLPALVGQLNPGGSLAVQMPDNLDEPAHRLMREVAANGPWAATLQSELRSRDDIGTPDWYYRLLKPHCQRVDVWRTTYQHALPGGPAAIVEWFKGSGLRPFLAPLDETQRTAFLEDYQRHIAVAYPAMDDGTVLLPFPRLFIVATR